MRSGGRKLLFILLVCFMVVMFFWNPHKAHATGDIESKINSVVSSEDISLVNEYASELYGRVQQVLVAIEKNISFKDTKNHPEQIGELLVKTRSALSKAESLSGILKGSVKDEETKYYREAFFDANKSLKSLYAYLIGLVDGQPSEKFWSDYLTNMGRYLDLSRKIFESREKDLLEKGVLYDLLAEIKAIMVPAIKANEEFISVLEAHGSSENIFLASVKARENTFHALVGINNLVFPYSIGMPAFRDAVKCTSLYRSYSLYMMRVHGLYGSNVENSDKGISIEIAELKKQSIKLLHEAEGVIRTLKGLY